MQEQQEQNDLSSKEAGVAGRIATAVVTAVAGWACFRFGTQGRLPTEWALAIALAMGTLAGVVIVLVVTGWLRRPRPTPEPEPADPEEELDPHDVDLVELIHAIVAEQQPRFTQAGTVLQAMASERIRVDAGRRYVTSEVSRLLDDSFEATRRLERGEVLIGVARKTLADGPVARVTVTDNRVGATTVMTLPLMQAVEGAVGAV